jgi:hypothetical protein
MKNCFGAIYPDLTTSSTTRTCREKCSVSVLVLLGLCIKRHSSKQT